MYEQRLHTNTHIYKYNDKYTRVHIDKRVDTHSFKTTVTYRNIYIYSCSNIPINKKHVHISKK